jgi:uncharacterized protein (DUF488 family)
MIYTIGYGNRTIEEFIDLLNGYQIHYLIDVRSAPYSKFNPDFSKDPLRTILSEHQIGYVFMGDQLGGKPDDERCYTPDGKIDYDKLSRTDYYQAGIARLQKAQQQQFNVVLMCSELKPESCHRGKLIGETLNEAGFEVRHIDENGELINQQAVIQRLTHGQLSFFEQTFTSNKKYLPDDPE